MATTTWDQKSGMTSATDVDNLESYAEQAEASKDAAAASATAAATSASAASASETAADASETASAASATAAAASATSAASSATNAASSATTASSAATTATTKASEASTSATNAATSETNAATSATAAASSASSAQSSADAALAALDSFDDRYLGQKASDPTVDNDGNALVAGALYFNTTDDVMKVYDGSIWVAAYASLSGALLAANNLSDLQNAASARTNLGLGTAATTASTDYATAAQGALADSALQSSDIGVSVQGYSAVLAGTTASYTTAEEAKLAGIEAGATADQTAAEIKTAYESNANTNAYTDAEKSKLAGIEAGADVTDAANVTAAGALMDSELTNITAVKALNQGVATTDTPTFAATTINGNITVTGTVDGRDVAADGTKLDGIEAGATADQTITAGSGLTGGGTGNVTVSHADTSTQASVNNSGATVIQDVTLDTYGHVTGLASATLTASTVGALASTNPVISAGTITEDVYTISGTSVSLEPDNGSVQLHTLTGTTTYTDGFTAGQAITLMIDDGSSRTVSWPTMTWVNNGGSAPTLATTGYTVVALWKVGSTLYGALVGDGS